MTVRAEWFGDRISQQVRKAAADGLLAGANVVKPKSQAVAPLKTAELRGSAYTDVDPSTLIAIVGYDVPRDIKAIKQHEDLSYHHPAGEQSKFLEGPLKASAGEVNSKVANALRRVLN